MIKKKISQTPYFSQFIAIVLNRLSTEKFYADFFAKVN